MVDLTEIYLGPVVYNEAEKKNTADYLLRRTLINPKYVIMMRPAIDLQEKAKNQDKSLIDGLNIDTPYTQLWMHCPSQVSALCINVVGGIGQICEKLTKE